MELKELIKARAEIDLECTAHTRELFATYVSLADPDCWVSVETLAADVDKKVPALLEYYFQIAATDIKSRYPIYNKPVKFKFNQEHLYIAEFSEFSFSESNGVGDKTKEVDPVAQLATQTHEDISLHVLLIDLTLYMKYVLGMDATIDGIHYKLSDSHAKQKFLIKRFKTLTPTRSINRFFIFKAVQEAAKTERDRFIDTKYSELYNPGSDTIKRDGIFWVARQIEWIKELEDTTMPPIRVVQSREWAEEVDRAMETIRLHKATQELAEPFDRRMEKILCQNLK